MGHSDKLRDTGLKSTLARVKLLELFERSERRHLSAEDVYQLLRAQGIDIGLATIYRSLAQFEQAGLLRRSQLGADRAIFELNHGGMRHGHLVSLSAQLLVVKAAPAPGAHQPSVEATSRDTERLAHQIDRPGPSVFRHEAELHIDSFAK